MAPFGRPWFRPRAYGYGATPNTWEGWCLTAGFVVALAATATLAAAPATKALIGLGLTAGFVLLCWGKTEGGWRWRWGDPR